MLHILGPIDYDRGKYRARCSCGENFVNYAEIDLLTSAHIDHMNDVEHEAEQIRSIQERVEGKD